MAISQLKQLYKKDYFKTIIALLLVACIIGGGFLGLQLILGTSAPIRVVSSGSMCTTQGGLCGGGFQGFMHPFDQTLHKGDIILIQGITPDTLNSDYPNSDIIVFKNPNGATPIVHRIVSKEEINGTLYFKTKGDSNGDVIWPGIPSYFDDIPDARGVPEDFIEGRVVIRIPFIGWLALFMQNNQWGLHVVIGLLTLLVIIEFIYPTLKAKRFEQQKNKQATV